MLHDNQELTSRTEWWKVLTDNVLVGCSGIELGDVRQVSPAVAVAHLELCLEHGRLLQLSDVVPQSVRCRAGVSSVYGERILHPLAHLVL